MVNYPRFQAEGYTHEVPTGTFEACPNRECLHDRKVDHQLGKGCIKSGCKCKLHYPDTCPQCPHPVFLPCEACGLEGHRDKATKLCRQCWRVVVLGSHGVDWNDVTPVVETKP